MTYKRFENLIPQHSEALVKANPLVARQREDLIINMYVGVYLVFAILCIGVLDFALKRLSRHQMRKKDAKRTSAQR